MPEESKTDIQVLLEVSALLQKARVLDEAAWQALKQQVASLAEQAPHPAAIHMAVNEKLCWLRPADPAQAQQLTIKKAGTKWVVYSENGKRLGEYATKAEAEKRLRQIEYYKHQ